MQRVEPTLIARHRYPHPGDPHRGAARVTRGARHGGWIDRAVMGFSVLGFSVPVFVIGYVLIYIFAVKLNLLPVQGYQPPRRRLRRIHRPR